MELPPCKLCGGNLIAICEKHLFTIFPAAKYPKHRKLNVSNIRDKSSDIFVALKR